MTDDSEACRRDLAELHRLDDTLHIAMKLITDRLCAGAYVILKGSGYGTCCGRWYVGFSRFNDDGTLVFYEGCPAHIDTAREVRVLAQAIDDRLREMDERTSA